LFFGLILGLFGYVLVINRQAIIDRILKLLKK
jgi:hypothetical protein